MQSQEQGNSNDTKAETLLPKLDNITNLESAFDETNTDQVPCYPELNHHPPDWFESYP